MSCPCPGGKVTGLTIRSVMMRVTRASDGGAQASDTAAAAPIRADVRKSLFIPFSLVHFALRTSSSPRSTSIASALAGRRDGDAERVAANVFRVLGKHPALANQFHQPPIHLADVVALVLVERAQRFFVEVELAPRDRAYEDISGRVGNAVPGHRNVDVGMAHTALDVAVFVQREARAVVGRVVVEFEGCGARRNGPLVGP